MDNNYGFLSTRFYRITEWIWRFAYLNLLWLGFSLLGLGLLGVFPATVALYTVLRNWLINDSDISIIKLFWLTFKKDFLRANILGFILVGVGFVIWFNYQYLGTVTGFEHTIIAVFWYMTMFLFILLILFLFPVYVHYKLPLLQYFKITIMFSMASPLALITLIIALGLAFQLFSLIPGLIPFYLISVIGWLIMWTSTHAFRRIDRKKQRIKNNEDSLRFRWKQFKEKVSSAID
ncbi:YesL family protein [Amphibacillus sp. Q70]|uniref:YesL family protein n=1 Tax=Amphibacillus sp. Q70 TaxID=3453416 RepID=UPI003F82C4B8